MIIDTLLLCFCEDCVLNDGQSKPYYMSKGLMVSLSSKGIGVEVVVSKFQRILSYSLKRAWWQGSGAVKYLQKPIFRDFRWLHVYKYDIFWTECRKSDVIRNNNAVASRVIFKNEPISLGRVETSRNKTNLGTTN